MAFTSNVSALRAALDIPPELSLPAAVHKMSRLMGLDIVDDDGDAVPLPLQVERLMDFVQPPALSKSTGAAGTSAGVEAQPVAIGAEVVTTTADAVESDASQLQTKKTKTVSQVGLGKFFGPALVVSYHKGQQVSSRISYEASELQRARAKLFCADCGKEFGHGPALAVHRKFCSAAIAASALKTDKAAVVDLTSDEQRAAEQTVSLDVAMEIAAGDSMDRPVKVLLKVLACAASAASVEQAVVLSDDDADDDDDNADLAESTAERGDVEVVQVRKKRRKDGGFKMSGLREGMKRKPYTLLFKYQVCLAFDKYSEMKQQGLLSNPLEATSDLYSGLALSNIWKWHQNKHKLQAALLHGAAAGGKTMKNRVGNIVPFSSRQARKSSLSQGRLVKFAGAEAELLSQFKAHRKKGLKVTERWMKITMKRIVQLHYGEEAALKFKTCRGWFAAFCLRNSLSWR